MAAVGGTCLDHGGEIVLDGKRIAVTHGDDTQEFRRLVGAQPDYLLFGHTHIALNERDGPIRQINPGACTAQRSGRSPCSIWHSIRSGFCR